MHRRIAGLAAYFLILAATGVSPEETPSKGLRWYSHFEGLELGRLENKNVLIHFYADWCGFCEKMERETYGNPDVAAYMGDHFILARVNTDRDRELAAAYFVRGLPMVWFVGPSGETLTALPGYVPPEQFLFILKFIYTKAYEKMTLGAFIDLQAKKP